MYISYHKSQYPSSPQPLSFQPRKTPSFTGTLLPSLALINRTDRVEDYHAILSTPVRFTLFLIPFYRNWSPIFKNKKIKLKDTWWRLLRVPWTPRRSNQSILKEINWIPVGRTDAEKPILWPPNARSQLIEKYSDDGKDWGQEEKEVTEDEMVGWHHCLNGHEFE